MQHIELHPQKRPFPTIPTGAILLIGRFLFAFLLIGWLIGRSLDQHSAPPPVSAPAVLPLTFAPNVGQLDETVAFEAIGAADPERLAITPFLLMSHPIVRALPIAVFIFKMHNVFAGDREKFFCSELVVAAYQDAGLTVFDGNPSEFSPDNLKHTKLTYMGELELG